MKAFGIILTGLALSSCGGIKFFESKVSPNQRDIASLTVKQLAEEEAQTFSVEIDDKLLSLHSYYVIAQSYLIQFDSSVEASGLDELYQSEAYLGLIATRTQIDEIEDELIELWSDLKANRTKASVHKIELLGKRMKAFSASSMLSRLSVQKLERKFGIESKKPDYKITHAEIKAEVERLQVSKEFQIYQKNIEHMSHLMSSRQKNKESKFYPSSLPQGQLDGSEFPAKVWALTFDDGPSKIASEAIVSNLKKNKLKATFFQLSKNVKELKEVSLKVKNAGMEIGAHSYSHKLLSTVGSLTLEKELIESTQDIEKTLKIDVKFFRLPYGVGVNIPAIRQKLADNQLIHVNYTVDTLDWIVQSPDKIVKRTLNLMKKTPKDSGIILFHDTHENTIEASAVIMNELNKDGRRACSVGEIVNQMNEGVETVCPRS